MKHFKRALFVLFTGVNSAALVPLVGASLWLSTLPVRAWNADGHMVSAQIAYNHLTPAAKARADFLISQPVFGSSSINNTFVTAGPWADDIKSQTSFFNNWHFIDLPFSYDGTSTNGFFVPSPNVLTSISNCVAALQDRTTSVSNQAINLRFLIHFVSDLQQPLHASDAVWAGHTGGDAGGNSFSLGGSPNNLHSLWDQGAGYVNDSEPRPLDGTGQATLNARVSDVESVYPYSQGFTRIPDIMPWALEGWYLAQTNAYVGVTPGSTPSAAYKTKVQNTTRQRMAAAGQRLADMVNILLGVTTNFVVNTLDSGPGSFRYAVSNSANGGIVMFTNTLAGQTIFVTNGNITLGKDILIDGSNLTQPIRLNGGHTNRILTVNSGVAATLMEVVLTNGYAGPGNLGGAIDNFGSLAMSDCTIAGNSVDATTSGGGIANESGGSIGLLRCTLSGNSAGFGGAMVNFSTANVVNSTCYGNSAASNGGAVDNVFSATLSMLHCTFSGNTASAGGDVDNYLSQLTITNTILGASAPDDIYNWSGSTVSAVGTNIVQVINNSGTINGAEAILPVDPLLAAPGNYGGPTLTMPPMIGSPAIDSGDDYAGSFVGTDQRGMGFYRSAGTHVDIGAVEAGDAIPGYVYGTVVNTNADFIPNGTVTNIVSLRSAVAFAAPGATITFATNLSGGRIILANGPLFLEQPVTIDGSSLEWRLAIDGNHSNNVFVSEASGQVLTQLTIQNGADSYYFFGAGIQNWGELTLNRCVVAGNLTLYGGGIYNGGTLTMNDCTVTNNTADLGGGIFNDYYAATTINRSTVAWNSANAGGGVWSGSTLAINDSTIAANTATNYGGGIDADNATGGMSATGCTIAMNGAGLAGAGVYVVTNFFANFTNTILQTGDGLDAYTGIVSTASCLTNANPLLTPLGYYGGPTLTMPPLAGSPAIDAGSDSVTNLLVTDQRGLPRKAGTHVDIGAVEVQAAAVTPPLLGGVGRLGNESIQFGFTNVPDASFSILSSTNLSWPINAWSNLGAAVEVPSGSGQYRFTDGQSTNSQQKFYRVRSP